MKSKTEVRLIPPDGGWGWWVVLGSSILNLTTRSIEPSFGLLFGDFLEGLGVATTGAAIVMSALDAMVNFSGLIVGPLIKKYSYRKVAVLGSLLSASALLLTSFVSNMYQLIFTYSILGGIGFGLATASTFVALNSFFSQKRGVAVGLAMAGMAVGFMTMPQIVSFLLNHFDFRSTVVILGAVSLNSLIGASLLQPVKNHLKPAPIPAITEDPSKDVEITLEEEAEEEKDVCASLLVPPSSPNPEINQPQPMFQRNLSVPSGMNRKLSASSAFQRQASAIASMPKNNSFVTNYHHSQMYGSKKLPHITSASSIAYKRKTSVISNVSYLDFMGSTVHIDYDSDSDCEGVTINFDPKTKNGKGGTIEAARKKSVNIWAKFSKMMDFDLLKDGVYLNILFGISICYVAELNFKMVVPFFMHNLGYTKQETASALSLMAISDIIARVTVPQILDRLSYSRRSSLMLGCVFVALTRSLIAEQTSTIPLMTCLVFHGFFRGFTLINFPLVLSEYATPEKFPAVLGLSMVSKGVFIVIFGPLGGVIRDLSNSYPVCIHTQSLMIMSCVVAWSIEHALRKPTSSNDTKKSVG